MENKLVHHDSNVLIGLLVQSLNNNCFLMPLAYKNKKHITSTYMKIIPNTNFPVSQYKLNLKGIWTLYLLLHQQHTTLHQLILLYNLPTIYENKPLENLINNIKTSIFYKSLIKNLDDNKRNLKISLIDDNNL